MANNEQDKRPRAPKKANTDTVSFRVVASLPRGANDAVAVPHRGHTLRSSRASGSRQCGQPAPKRFDRLRTERHAASSAPNRWSSSMGGSFPVRRWVAGRS